MNIDEKEVAPVAAQATQDLKHADWLLAFLQNFVKALPAMLHALGDGIASCLPK